MDHTTVQLYAIIVVVLAIAAYFVPKAEPRIKRATLIVGSLPTLVLEAVAAQIEASGSRAGGIHALALMCMFVGPMATIVLAEVLDRRKRRSQREK